MARFYGGVQGHRGQATRLGSKESGMDVFAQGWDIGVRVMCYVGPGGEDCVDITLTGGTNGRCSDEHLGTFQRNGSGFKRLGRREQPVRYPPTEPLRENRSEANEARAV